MLQTSDFISRFTAVFVTAVELPWKFVDELESVLESIFPAEDSDYYFINEAAIHKTAVIEQGVILKGRIIIEEHVFVGANAYLRGPLLLDRNVRIGPGSEIKESVVFEYATTAHFNYIGNSIIGSHVNFEAGAVCANHYNELADKHISVHYNGKIIPTHLEKFGALVGDHSKVGANAVLSPGTLLPKGSIVGRLELVDQLKATKAI